MERVIPFDGGSAYDLADTYPTAGIEVQTNRVLGGNDVAKSADAILEHYAAQGWIPVRTNTFNTTVLNESQTDIFILMQRVDKSKLLP